MTDSELAAIGSVVDQAYEALTFAPGEQPEWGRFSQAFIDGAILALRVFPDDLEVSVVGLQEYAVAQMRNDLGSQGYSETPGPRTSEIFGDVAVVRQSFTMNFIDREVPAVDFFSLARTGENWKIVSVVSDIQG